MHRQRGDPQVRVRGWRPSGQGKWQGLERGGQDGGVFGKEDAWDLICGTGQQRWSRAILGFWLEKVSIKGGGLDFHPFSSLPSCPQFSFGHAWPQCESGKSQHKGALPSVFICRVPTPNLAWMVPLHSCCSVPPPLRSVSTLSPLAAHSSCLEPPFLMVYEVLGSSLVSKGLVLDAPCWSGNGGKGCRRPPLMGPARWWLVDKLPSYTVRFSPTGKGPLLSPGSF